MTHKELTDRASRWLKNTMHCSVIFKDLHSYASERPDVLGWRLNFSILVECKTSSSDFYHDRQKRRRPSFGMGNYRYYLCASNLIKPEQVPKKWGLLWVLPKIIKVKKTPLGFWSPRILKKERPLVYAALNKET